MRVVLTTRVVLWLTAVQGSCVHRRLPGWLVDRFGGGSDANEGWWVAGFAGGTTGGSCGGGFESANRCHVGCFKFVEVGLLFLSSNQWLSLAQGVARGFLTTKLHAQNVAAFASVKLPRKTVRRDRRWHCAHIVVDVPVPRPRSGCQVLRQPPTACEQCMLLTRIVTKFDT